MANAKEIIELKSYSNGSTYEVIKLSNRVEPSIGIFLTKDEVVDLIMETKRPYSKLSVKIS